MTAQSDAATVELALTGMHCESCSSLIEEVLSEHPGVSKVMVDLEAEFATVTYDASAVGSDELCATVVEAGYGATVRVSS